MIRTSSSLFALLLGLIFLSVSLFATTGFAQLVEQLGTMSVADEMEGRHAEAATNTVASPSGDDASGGGMSAQIAQDKATASKLGPLALQNGWLGTGGYLSIIKIVLFILVFLAWVFTVDWVSADSELQKIPDRMFWNMINFFPFVVGGGVLLYLPVELPILFFISYPLTILTWLIPAFAYIKVRNKPLPPFERVMTPGHLKLLLATVLAKIGIKIRVEKQRSYEGGPPLEIVAAGKNLDDSTLNARTLLARNHEGFNDLRTIVYDGLQRHADGIMFDFQAEQTIVREQIDGVWIDSNVLPKEKGVQLNTSLKHLIGGNPNEFRARQAGSFMAKIKPKTKFDADFVIQGMPNGEEKGLITFVIQTVPFDTLEQLGARPELQEKLKGLMNAPKGMVVFSAMPGNGLRSTMNVVARTADRFTREFATVEDVQNPYQFVENIMLNQYDSRKGENPMTILADVFFREPQVLLIRDLINTETFELCCKEIDENNRLIITTVRAKDAADAILRLLAMKVTPTIFASTLHSVVSQRLIRKLCPDCKEVFEPQPALLQRLGLPPGRVTQLCRVRSEPLPNEKRKPCLTCNDLGYKGRTAIYEIIEINDEIRKVLAGKPTHEAIRKAANQSGQRGFMFEGALLVAKGITSVEELARVMKM